MEMCVCVNVVFSYVYLLLLPPFFFLQVGCYTAVRRVDGPKGHTGGTGGEGGGGGMFYRVPVCRYAADAPRGGSGCTLPNYEGCSKTMVRCVCAARRAWRGGGGGV